MARDVEADVNINDKSKPGLSSFLAGLKKSEDQLKNAEKEMDRAGKGTSKLGSAAAANAKNIAKLTQETARAQDELGKLARAFAETEDAAKRMDISKAMRRQQTEIRNLNKNNEILKALTPDPAELAGIGQKISAGIGRSLSSAPPLAAGLAAVGVAVAPTIAAAVSGAVVGGVGAGGVIGGIALVSQDTRVQTAFKGFTTNIQSDLQQAAIPFIDTTIAGIHEIGSALDTIDFDGIFENASKLMPTLVAGVSEAIEGIGNGLEDIFGNAGPAVEALSDGISEIGTAVGDVFSNMADDADAGAAAIDDLTLAVTNFIQLSGAIIDAGAAVKGYTEDLDGAIDSGRAWIEDNSAIAEDLRKVGIELDLTADGYAAGSEAAQLYRDGVIGVAGAANDYAAYQAQANEKTQESVSVTSDYQRAMMSAEEATKAQNAALQQQRQDYENVQQALSNYVSMNASLYASETNAAAAIDTATQAIAENGAGLDINTEKGRTNRDTIASLGDALRGNYENMVELNGLTPETVAAGEQARAAFVKVAVAAGYGADQAQALATKILGIPDAHNTDLTVEAQQAISQAQNYLAILRSIPAYKRTVIETAMVITGNTNSSAVNSALRKNSAAFAEAAGNFSTGQGGRTGGATAVLMDHTVTVTTNTDLFNATVDSRIRENERRNKWEAQRTVR